MPDRFVARRDSGEDEWHWYPVPIDGPQRGTGFRRPWRGLLLAAIGAVLICVGVVLVALSADGSGSQPSATHSPAASISATLGATSVPTGRVTPTPVTSAESPAATGDVRLFVWSRQDKQWLDSDNTKDEPGYREGEAVPFMLRIEDTISTGVYEIAIEYECGTPDGAAFDYLSSVSEADGATQMTPPGPMGREDSSILIPDDPSITFDGSGRRFRMWGGSFEEIPQGPSPAGPCETEKRVSLSLLSQGDTLFLIWGGHLAARSDWGENQGASSQRAPIHIEASVNQTDAKRLGVGPDSIAP